MPPAGGLLAILFPGQSEWIVILVLGLLLFGRRLPEVGRGLGRTFANLRRGFDDFKAQIDQDESLREARTSVHEIKRAVQMPRVASDPKRLFKKLTEDPVVPAPPVRQSPGMPIATIDPNQPASLDPHEFEDPAHGEGGQTQPADPSIGLGHPDPYHSDQNAYERRDDIAH